MKQARALADGPPSAYWGIQAKTAGCPVFPIRIEWSPARRKFEKRPLTERGHWAASAPEKFDWSRADGFGIPMGEMTGLYAIDVDDVAEDGPAMSWVRTRGLDKMRARDVETPSGGRHLIFRLPAGQERLPSRANIVPGLDARGHGGWVAFGQGYTLADEGDDPLPELPRAVCDELRQGWNGGAVDTPEPGDIEPAQAGAWIIRRVAHRSGAIAQTWGGWRKPGGDATASGMDHSLAALMALDGASYSMIVAVLRDPMWLHGVVSRDGVNRKTERAIRRCAAKAVAMAAENAKGEADMARRNSPDNAAMAASALFGDATP